MQKITFFFYYLFLSNRNVLEQNRDAAKELAELDRLMQLSLKENDDLSKKILELEIKMKLLENNVRTCFQNSPNEYKSPHSYFQLPPRSMTLRLVR